MARGHAWQVRGVHGMGAHAWQGACMTRERGCVAGGLAWWRVCMAVGVCMAGETATAADGTHPTGMLSCLIGNQLGLKLCSSLDKPHNSFLRTCWHLSLEHKGNVPGGEWAFDLSAIDICLTCC